MIDEENEKEMPGLQRGATLFAIAICIEGLLPSGEIGYILHLFIRMHVSEYYF
jgi:hypothetical protein